MTDGIQAHYDDLGNVIVNPGESDPDRTDTLFDSAGNDTIRAFRGGNDTIDGNSDDDTIDAGAGKDSVLGGAGMDVLLGQAGEDKLYAKGESTVTAALEYGATQQASGMKGDFLDGGADKDILIGDAGDDALLGGGGNDILIGGGNDYLAGDYEQIFVNLDWSVTRSVTEETVAGGSGKYTLYSAEFTNAYLADSATGGENFLYGGAGDDWLIGGAKTDLLNGGANEMFGGGGDSWSQHPMRLGYGAQWSRTESPNF